MSVEGKGKRMDGNETDAGGHDRWHNGNSMPGRHQPLGSTASTRLLMELVTERLRPIIGSDPVIGGDDAVEVDVESGVVRVQDRRWSATLAPLAAQLADTPPEGWSIVVDREVERWRKAMTAVTRLAHTEGRRRPPPDAPPILLRLATASGAPGRALRPAFGNVAWELVRDLGAGGRALLTVGSDEPGAGTDRFWDRIAAETLARHEEQWADLPLDGAMGVILSGPHVSALLYDLDRLRDRVEEPTGSMALRVGVVTNSLLLITPGAESIRPTADVVAESLRRFASGLRRHFDPFTLELPDTDVS